MSEFIWLCRVRWHIQHWQFHSEYFMSDSAEIVLTFSVLLSGRAVYVWLCRDFDFHTEQLSAENSPTFRQVCSVEQPRIFWFWSSWSLRTDFFSAYLSGRAVYVWLCRDFDFHTEQLSAENSPTFRRIQTGLLCRVRSNIFIRVAQSFV